jgi:hypothetical protein
MKPLEHNRFLILEKEKGSQGHNPHHAENPYHRMLVHHGFNYSHTTRCFSAGGNKFAYHTYKLAEHLNSATIGIRCYYYSGRHVYNITASRLGSGRFRFIIPSKLETYLKRKVRYEAANFPATGSDRTRKD